MGCGEDEGEELHEGECLVRHHVVVCDVIEQQPINEQRGHGHRGVSVRHLRVVLKQTRHLLLVFASY